MTTTENPGQAEDVAKAVTTVAARAEWSQSRTILRVIIIVLVVAAAIWVLHAVAGVLLLVVLAIFFAYTVSPLVELVRRPFKLRGSEHTMPRIVALSIVYLSIFGCVAITVYLLLPRLGEQITEFAKQAPTYLVSARGRAKTLNDLYQHYQLPPAFRETIDDTVDRSLATVRQYAVAQMTNVAGWVLYIPWFALIPILAFFFLKDADGFRHEALQIFPRGRMRWRADEFFQDVNSTLAAYIRAQLSACLFIGIVCIIGFYILGVPYPLMLGVIAGLLEFIPLIGPVLVAVLAVLVTSFHSLSQAVWVLVFLLVLRLVEDYVVYPRLIGHGIHLHPLAIILAVLCGAEMAGIAGIFLAIPVVAIISIGYRHWLEHRGKEGLVADLLKPEPQVVTAIASTESAGPELTSSS
jgi:predicted PurR-regulated permease PerM